MTAYMDHKDLANTIITPQRRSEIYDGVLRTQEKLNNALSKAGRSQAEATLLAATKTRDVGEILAAIDAGIVCIGENRPQEVIAKADGLAQELKDREKEIPLHLIGQLQSNKISKIVPFVSTIESVDSVKLAERISRRLDSTQKMNVFLEVNESGEESKSGCKPEEALEIAENISQLDGIQLTGLMTIGTHIDDEKTERNCFSNLRNLRDEINNAGIKTCTELSMGMSADLEWAIAEGSTIVRVGTGIFGARAFI
ncbi:YggS family pyridoxal phosphate-dependent enzyme [Alloscardovia theropitheci]|uniref:Pyridoxal phosphate homeostasis protein n=1 Tax=Alloscardovia theropitheci TaxID=2496842 RepID=A0A4R0QQD3_9BIFI|nr:YggS family pyridoxal phosphate-dependent enzyme [Alloscardovia theropitheci]TCD54513.1 YggS family pyridoxal phosphate-dependent enzyme [Alloscardovia theropitheci]